MEKGREVERNVKNIERERGDREEKMTGDTFLP